MVSVWNDYESKVNEINLYFNHLEQTHYDEDLYRILKANGFLMLYNLIESTVRNALEEIHTSFSSENLTYDQCIDQIQAIWIDFEYKKFKDRSSKTITANLKNIKNDVVKIVYSEYVSKLKSSDLSGNLDKRKIETLAEKYNFKKNTRILGTELFIVKSRRNRLAHGEESFIDVGKNHTISDLIKIKRVSIVYLKELLLNIDKYIKEKDFKN